MKDRASYMREYMKRRYHERRAMAVDYLGGKCARCGSLDNLEIDHIDQRSKEYGVDQLRSLSLDGFWHEIKKCQLLCRECHQHKTMSDLGLQYVTHGSVAKYRRHGCRCYLCQEAHKYKVRAERARRKMFIPLNAQGVRSAC